MSVDAFLLGVLIDELTNDAERLYKVLEADTHQSTYRLIGKKVLVTIDRKVYESAAGNILEKGKVITANMNGGIKDAQVQPDESDAKDVEVGKEKEEQGEGELTKKPSKEEAGAYAEEILYALETEKQIEKWWNGVRDFWAWSGCIVGDRWDELMDDGKEEVRKVYNSFKEVVE